MKFFLMAFFLVCLAGSSDAQQSGQPQYISAIAGFYNLENLFDTINDPAIDDEEFLPASEKKYGSQMYSRKLNNLADVISAIGIDVNPDGLALLGVVEVENERVLQDLVNTAQLKARNYAITHFQSPDARGIDVGLIYNPKYFKVITAQPCPVTLPEKYPTRDILLVKGELAGDTVFLLVNHWPSRRGGGNNFDLANKDAAYNRNNSFRDRQNQIDLRSNTGLRTDGEELTRPARMAAANTCQWLIDSLYSQHPRAKLMIMGDFNDDPNSPSIAKGLNAKDDIAATGGQEVFNPFAQYLRQGYGTLVFNGKWNLFDQVLFSKPWLDMQQQDGWFLYKSHIFYRDFLIEQSGDYKGYPKRSWVGNRWNNGYSDHLPVYTVLLRVLP